MSQPRPDIGEKPELDRLVPFQRTHQRDVTWVEISASNYRHNLDQLRTLVADQVELSLVVKANAYGHGWAPITALASGQGIDRFCVHTVNEGLQLRQVDAAARILVLGYVPPQCIESAVNGRLDLVVYNRQTLDAIEAQAGQLTRNAALHLKLETGMNRQGIDESELDDVIARLLQGTGYRLVAACTHLATSDEVGQANVVQAQLQTFERMMETLHAAGFAGVRRHVANSGAVLQYAGSHFDQVRLGLAQYGLWPSLDMKQQPGMPRIDLQPVLQWKSRVAQVKRVGPGQGVSYGGTFQTARESVLAVIPIGYAEGYDRQLSNRGQVLVRGQRAPVRGRVCMDMIVVEVTDIPGVSVDDEVVLLGRQGSDEISADELAAWLSTINYEVVTRINGSIPRYVV